MKKKNRDGKEEPDWLHVPEGPKDFHQETARKILEKEPSGRCPKCGEKVGMVEEKFFKKKGDAPTTKLMVYHCVEVDNDDDNEGFVCEFNGILGDWLKWVEEYKKQHPDKRVKRESAISHAFEQAYGVTPLFYDEGIEPKKKRIEPFIYYCEQCFHARGTIVVMWEGPTSDGDNRLHCRECQGEWKLNRGQARHIVSLKLQHYRRLADKLGILEVEEETDPVTAPTTDSRYQELRSTLQRLIKHWRTDSPRKRLKTVDEALKHIVDNLHTILSRGKDFVHYKGTPK